MESRPASSKKHPTTLVVPVSNWKTSGRPGHCVTLYNHDSMLIDLLGAFILEGLESGESVLVIATEPHRRALDTYLREHCIDLSSAASRARYVAVDAAETLATFMVNGLVDAKLFESVAGSLMARLSEWGRPVRAFGEMVALLWSAGNVEGAIQLEKLWNRIARNYSFSLLCAYPSESFRGEPGMDSLQRVCDQHACVLVDNSQNVELPALMRRAG